MTDREKSVLFSSVRLGAIEAPNRIVMAPMTRCRASADGTPTPIMAQYYKQRASAGLIITEATWVHPDGIGYGGTPGLQTHGQAEGWKPITKAVHDNGGRIFAQLWHVGRISHPLFLNGRIPVSASAIRPQGESYTAQGPKPYETPRALTLEQISEVIEYYRVAAENARIAGFDGVELHGANGYLPDQFLRDKTNQRTDKYGGSIENRARFMIEVTKALVSVWGSDRVGVRLSPSGTFNDMADSNPKETFGYVVKQLGLLNLAYLHITEGSSGDIRHGGANIPVSFFKPLTKTPIITNSEFTFEKAQEYLRDGYADAIAFGSLFLANPDLPERFRTGAALNAPNPNTFYAGGETGYIDYPSM
jgi:N-ethylmaleimide reductase